MIKIARDFADSIASAYRLSTTRKSTVLELRNEIPGIDNFWGIKESSEKWHETRNTALKGH